MPIMFKIGSAVITIRMGDWEALILDDALDNALSNIYINNCVLIQARFSHLVKMPGWQFFLSLMGMIRMIFGWLTFPDWCRLETILYCTNFYSEYTSLQPD